MKCCSQVIRIWTQNFEQHKDKKELSFYYLKSILNSEHRENIGKHLQ